MKTQNKTIEGVIKQNQTETNKQKNRTTKRRCANNIVNKTEKKTYLNHLKLECESSRHFGHDNLTNKKMKISVFKAPEKE